MAIRRILSITVLVDDLAAARRFYEDALDIPASQVTPAALVLYWGETKLNLLQPDDASRHLVGRETGLTLRMRGTGDLGVLVQRLQEKGFADCGKDYGGFRSGTRLRLRDPSGNWLTLLEDDTVASDLTYYEGPSSVALRCRDIRRSLAFYLSVLEIPMLEQPEPGTAILFPGGTNLVLAEGSRWSAAPPASGETGVCLLVDDFHSVVDALAGQRVPFAEAPREVEKHVAASIRDPDGNVLNLLGERS